MTALYGQVHVMVANAAIIGPIGPFAEHRPRDWKEVFETNVIGVMNACRTVLPQMIQRRSGKILVIADSSSSTPRPNFAPYSASKAAVVRFVESVAEEVRDHNVQINCFSPGGAYTSMTDEILEADDRAGSKEVEEAEQIRLTGGVPADKTDPACAVSLFRAVQPSDRQADRCHRRLEEARTREYAARCLDTQASFEIITMRRALFLIAAIPLLSVSAFGWGCEGHQMVALIARAHLTPAASKAVDQLLRDNPIDPALSRFCTDRPSDLMADSATWADDARTIEKTADWHFIDIPLAVPADPANEQAAMKWCKPAAGGKPGCIVSAIDYEWAILRDTSQPGPDAREGPPLRDSFRGRLVATSARQRQSRPGRQLH